MDLDECLRKKMIRKTVVNSELIKSILETAESKEIAIKTAKINEKTVSAYVSLAYDSLRETLEAVCIKLGYKVLSHICIGELLRKELKDFPFDEFDRYRYIRNGINYYGTKINLREGKEIIYKILKFKSKMAKEYL